MASQFTEQNDDAGTEHERLLQFMYLLPVGVVSAAADGRVTAMNPFAIQALMPIAASTGFQSLFTMLEKVFPNGLKKIESFTPPSGPICDREVVEVPLETDASRAIFLEVSISRLGDQGFMAVFSDVSTRVAMERELRHQSERLRMVVEFIRDYVIYTLDSEGRVDTWNKSGERNAGISNASAMGLRLEDMLMVFCGPGFDAAQLLEQVRNEGSVELEGKTTTPGGDDIWFQKTITMITDEQGSCDGYSVIAHNITQQKHLELRLKHLAETDPLTGAANRRAWMAHCDLALTQLATGDELVVAMLDIDHFKRLNDSYGHAIGDEALKLFVKTITGALRKGDLLGRVGGEEFTLLLFGANRTAAIGLLERLRGIVEALRIPTADGDIQFTVSIGFTLVKHGELLDASQLLDKADKALYRAKESGRNRVLFSDD